MLSVTCKMWHEKEDDMGGAVRKGHAVSCPACPVLLALRAEGIRRAMFVLRCNGNGIGVCCDCLRVVSSPYPGIKAADAGHIFIRQLKVEYIDILCDSFRLNRFGNRRDTLLCYEPHELREVENRREAGYCGIFGDISGRAFLKKY